MRSFPLALVALSADRANVFSFAMREGYMWGGWAFCSIQ
jgi:hypothetical protein